MLIDVEPPKQIPVLLLHKPEIKSITVIESVPVTQ